jgi:Ca2+-binding RTX toxin-like protein
MGRHQFRWFDTNPDYLIEKSLTNIFEAPIVGSSSTRLVLGTGSTDFRLTVAGTGFAYNRDGSAIVGATAGTISSISMQGFGDYSELSYDMTNLNLSMKTFTNLVFAQNWLSLTAYLFSKADLVLEGTGYDVISSCAGDDTVYGGHGDDSLSGGAGNDKLYGGSWADYLYGESGNDSLFGGTSVQYSGVTGVDHLFGGAGDDNLFSGPGFADLTGGSGRDAFIFNSALRVTQRDTITDFRAVDDVVRLENSVFTAFTTLGTMLQSRFHVGVSAADAGDRIIYDRAEGVLSYDRDGTGAAAAVVFALVDPGTALGYQDIVII